MYIVTMRLEIPLTILSLVLMGGNMFLPWAPAHEIIGVTLMVVWGAHIYANRRWFKATFRGRYNPFRITQAVVNYGMLICVAFLAISGVMLSNHVFAFLGIESGANFARTAHLLASHWYFVFISLHIGLHVGVIFNRLKVAQFIGGITRLGVCFVEGCRGSHLRRTSQCLWHLLLCGTRALEIPDAPSTILLYGHGTRIHLVLRG